MTIQRMVGATTAMTTASGARRFDGNFRLLALLAGGLVTSFCIVLILEQWRQVISVLSVIGPVLPLLAAAHIIPTLVDSRGWLVLVRGLGIRDALSARYVGFSALVREAIVTCMPMSGIGSCAAALRLLGLKGVDSATAMAGIVAESTIALATQLLLVLASIGAWAICRQTADSGQMQHIVGAAVAVALLTLAVAFQISRRLQSSFSRLLCKLGGVERARLASNLLDNTYQRLDRLYRNSRACLEATSWQILALSAGVAELWFMLSLLAVPRSLLIALSLAGTARIVRTVAMTLPVGFGFREFAFGGVLVSAGQSFEIGIAVSVAMRARDLLFGAPFLLAWLHLESFRRHASQEAMSEASIPEDTL